jgi:hypothetical protein
MILLTASLCQEELLPEILNLEMKIQLQGLIMMLKKSHGQDGEAGSKKLLCRRSAELIELARKTFSLGEQGNEMLLKVPREITLENFPRVIDDCPIIKKVYAFRVKLHALEKGPPLSDGQKFSLLIDSAQGISQLAKIVTQHEALLDKIKNQQEGLSEEEEDVLDDLTIALSRILLSKSITVTKKRKYTRRKPAQPHASPPEIKDLHDFS